MKRSLETIVLVVAISISAFAGEIPTGDWTSNPSRELPPVTSGQTSDLASDNSATENSTGVLNLIQTLLEVFVI